MSQAELKTLHRVDKASSERLDTVRRAKALLAVAGGESFTQAALGVVLRAVLRTAK